jgi:hypothetical protein
MISFQRLLFEEPESGPNAIFGKYLFDKTRDDVSSKRKENETELEREFRNAVGLYLDDNKKKRLDALIPDILKYTAAENLYQRILKPDTVTVYRTLNIYANAVSSILPLDIKTLQSQKVGSIAGVTLQPTPGTEIQGWSTEKELGHLWLRLGPGDKFLAICAKTTTDKATFFGAPGELARATGNKVFVTEMETLSYGPVPCDEVRFFTQEFYLSRPDLQEKINDYVSFATDKIPVR